MRELNKSLEKLPSMLEENDVIREEIREEAARGVEQRPELPPDSRREDLVRHLDIDKALPQHRAADTFGRPPPTLPWWRPTR